MLNSEKESLRNLFVHLPKWEDCGNLRISDKCVQIRLFTEEQVLAAEEKGKRVFRGIKAVPGGGQLEFPYILVTYEDLIRNAL